MHSLPEPGTIISDKYRLETLLGEGGMGAVFRARHILMDKSVALKWLQPGLASHPEARDRFVREAQAAARIRHPNVVDVYDVGEHGEALFMVMELLEGQNLAEVLRVHRVPVLRVLELLVEAMRGVAAAHTHGIIHRDIKPENVFIVQSPDRPATAKILDFGISKLGTDGVDTSLTGTGVAMGTPAFMSREQMNGAKDVDVRTDVYSFGVILYQVLTGISPFEGDSFAEVAVKVVTFQPPPPSELRPELPRALDAIVLTAMAVRREDRYPTLDMLIEAVSSVVATAQRSTASKAMTVPKQRMPDSISNRYDPITGRSSQGGYSPTPTTQDFPRVRGPRSTATWVALGTLIAAALGGGAFYWSMQDRLAETPAASATTAAQPASQTSAPPTTPTTAGPLDLTGEDTAEGIADDDAAMAAPATTPALSRPVHVKRPGTPAGKARARKGHRAAAASRELRKARRSTPTAAAEAATHGSDPPPTPAALLESAPIAPRTEPSEPSPEPDSDLHIDLSPSKRPPPKTRGLSSDQF